jgi:hypothetical protein
MTTRTRLVQGTLAGLVLLASAAAAQTAQPAQPAAPNPPAPRAQNAPAGPRAASGMAGVRLAAQAGAAKALGITVDDLAARLAAGQTWKEISAERNVSLDAVAAGMADGARLALDAAVKAGRLTADQANTALVVFRARALLEVNGVGAGARAGASGARRGGALAPRGGAVGPRGPMGGQMGGQMGGPMAGPATRGRAGAGGGAQGPAMRPGGAMAAPQGPAAGAGAAMGRALLSGRLLEPPAVLDAASGALGVSSQALRGELLAGRSVAEVARARNVDLAAVQKAVADAVRAALAVEVTAGRLTQAQSDTLSAGLEARVLAALNARGGIVRMMRPGR